LRIGNTTGASKGSRRLARGRAILHAELGDRHVAYVVSAPTQFEGEQQMHIRNLSTGADKVVYRAGSGGANFANITRASYVAKPKGFLWARTEHRLGTRQQDRALHAARLEARLRQGDLALHLDEVGQRHARRRDDVHAGRQ
jgi:hypothetical protein